MESHFVRKAFADDEINRDWLAASGFDIAHDRFQPGLRSGVFDLTWTIRETSPVVIGSGEVEVARNNRLIAGHVRRENGMPVLPGTSLKGAVRQLYEMLTPSCDPTNRKAPPDRRACDIKPHHQVLRLCPACAMFGAGGFAGRVSFGEARPLSREAVRIDVREAVVGHTPGRDRWGHYKLYGRARRGGRRSGPPRRDGQRTVEPVECVMGTFTSKLKLVNVTDREIGLLVGAMRAWGTPFSVMLGGRKYDGFGEAIVVLSRWREKAPQRRELDEAECKAWAWNDLFVEHALTHPDCGEAWERIQNALGGSA